MKTSDLFNQAIEITNRVVTGIKQADSKAEINYNDLLRSVVGELSQERNWLWQREQQEEYRADIGRRRNSGEDSGCGQTEAAGN